VICRSADDTLRQIITRDQPVGTLQAGTTGLHSQDDMPPERKGGAAGGIRNT
jgi:hypothetical protein